MHAMHDEVRDQRTVSFPKKGIKNVLENKEVERDKHLLSIAMHIQARYLEIN